MVSVLLPGSVVAVCCCIITPKVYIFQDSTATFPGPVPSGYSTLQARHGHTQAYYSHQQAGLASHKIPPPSGFSGPAQGSQGGARYRNMAHLGTLPRPLPQEFSRSSQEKEYLMPGASGYHGGAGPESNI